MTKRFPAGRLAAASSMALIAALLGGAPAVAGDGRAGSAAVGQQSVVASGLNSPRQLTFGPGGSLFVAEAGAGGPTADQAGNCVPFRAFQG